MKERRSCERERGGVAKEREAESRTGEKETKSLRVQFSGGLILRTDFQLLCIRRTSEGFFLLLDSAIPLKLVPYLTKHWLHVLFNTILSSEP